MDSGHTTERPRIVVGVDGFEPSMAALRWAIHQARLTGAVVEAVTAWHVPVGTGWLSAADMPDYQEDGRDVLCQAIAQMYAIDPDIQVCPRVVEGPAGQVLVDAAEGADLLVVGCRGHGGHVGAVLGSVSQFCAHHAPCPVVIMRGKPALCQPAGSQAPGLRWSPWSANRSGGGVLADIDPGRGVGRCSRELAHGGVGGGEGAP